MSFKEKNSGFTLIELTTVMVLLGILGVSALSAGSGWIENWQISSIRQDLFQEGTIALDRMVREISQLRNRASITTAGDTTFTFTDVNDQSITFQFTGGTLQRNGQNLAENTLATSRFRYYASDLGELDGSVDHTRYAVFGVYTNVRLIRIELNLSRDGQTINLRTAVAPPNLQLQ